MKNQKTLSIAALIAASLSVTAAHGATFGAANFENNAIGVNNNPIGSTGTVNISSIGMDVYPTPNVGVTTDDVLVGKASDTGNNGVANTSQIWRVRAQAGSTGAANGWSSLAPIGTQGAIFAASTVGFNNITVSFDYYATTQGEANMQAMYTTDGINWHNVALTLGGSDAGLQVLNNIASPNTVMGSYVSDNLLNNAMGGQDWFTGLTATITDPNAANDPNFAFEFVNASTGVDCLSTQGTALNNTSGNIRLDNFLMTGTSAAPEPSTFALAGCGLALFAGLRRLKSRKA